MSSSAPPIYDCLVLSGGGAKGAYGAGVAKALSAYSVAKNVERPRCYFGASVGALNAAVLATADADALVNLWRSMTNRLVLGVWIRNSKFQGSKNWLKGEFQSKRPYFVYSSAALLKLITENTSFDRLRHPLVIAVTNYTQGRLTAFYHSPILDNAVKEDGKRPQEAQRFGHFQALNTKNFHSCLLASASIPVFFPPVEIDGDLYIDGGVGNNTPTREAAYFLRYVEEHDQGKAGCVYCVALEPPGGRCPGPDPNGVLGILDRTLSIYHYVHTRPILDAWFRINKEVKSLDDQLESFLTWIYSQEEIQNPLKQSIREKLKAVVRVGGPNPRISAEMQVVQPSTNLGETLDFNPATIDESIKRGYVDMLGVLQAAKKIDYQEYNTLVNAKVWG